ncbi:hypothetical protein K7X08_015355 [Anisodus acutangulus]|uniref:RanBP2-type domain-containing protein n=1 Tax=Anisodus acutangulus TaxID=402998 RepID=A0A9Q1L4A5_9SOLA|nr:hypothetical protein K7X08_015355 [Anisodus acutangulus]
MNCGSHNYASRTSCYRCGALKGDYYGYGYDTSALPGWKSGDWICSSCPKYATPADVAMYGLNKTEVMAGDWYCSAMYCGSHNYASRTSCYRCGALKNDYYGIGAVYGYDASALPGWKSGDWICSRIGCGMHNYASRAECYKCKTSRDFGGDLRESELY